MKWHHIEFWFDIPEHKKHTKVEDVYLDSVLQEVFEHYLKWLITQLRPYIKRKFYLYEPSPHCFLALEWEIGDFEVIAKRILRIKKLHFIKRIELKKHSDDEGNGEGFLDVLDSFTDFYLSKRGSQLTHIIHCSMEFIHQSRKKELEFYEKMLYLYGGEKHLKALVKKYSKLK